MRQHAILDAERHRKIIQILLPASQVSKIAVLELRLEVGKADAALDGPPLVKTLLGRKADGKRPEVVLDLLETGIHSFHPVVQRFQERLALFFIEERIAVGGIVCILAPTLEHNIAGGIDER